MRNRSCTPRCRSASAAAAAACAARSRRARIPSLAAITAVNTASQNAAPDPTAPDHEESPPVRTRWYPTSTMYVPPTIG
ncbi:hypothetical protein SAMN05443637_12485 [Pseudonocardia thermophila]|uniref:Secreted protein n=1 Tax=Pseudonocardia thermophila TaxID=1848 RepID=A0A1M6ZNW8_PSETH|nr:hypothetical protein SAMN05443637_12485 [Pseudonocardia thermophila]